MKLDILKDTVLYLQVCYIFALDNIHLEILEEATQRSQAWDDES